MSKVPFCHRLIEEKEAAVCISCFRQCQILTALKWYYIDSNPIYMLAYLQETMVLTEYHEGDRKFLQ